VVDGELVELLELPVPLEELGGACVPMFGHLWVVVDPEEPEPVDVEPEEPEPEELEPDDVEPDDVVVPGSVVEVDPVDPVVVEDDAALVAVVVDAAVVPVEPVVNDVVELVEDVPVLAVEPVEADWLVEGLVEPVAALAATAPPSTRPAASAPIPITFRTLRCMSPSLQWLAARGPSPPLRWVTTD
jgi:hypothetical protein